MTETSPKKRWLSTNPGAYGTVIFIIVALAIAALAADILNLKLPTVGQSDFSSLSVIAFIGVVAGFSTCALLTGGFIAGITTRYAALHPEASLRRRLSPHVWFHLGRLASFFLLGGLLGVVGSTLANVEWMSNILILVSGLALLYIGLQLSGLSPRVASMHLRLPSAIVDRFAFLHSHQYSHVGSVFLGFVSFFIPCGFTQAVQVYALTTGSFLTSAITMATFALGTTVGLWLIALVSNAFSGLFKQWFYVFVGVLLLWLGATTVYNSLYVLGIIHPEVGVQNGKFAPMEGGRQVIRMTQNNQGYTNIGDLKFKVNVPARLIINSTESLTCASTFSLPEYNIRQQLKIGDNFIDFTPTRPVALSYSCSMGMFRGSIGVE